MPSIFDIFTDLKPRSVLPSGGSPETDRAYLLWRTGFVDATNNAWLDSRTEFGHELPTREPIEHHKIDEAIFTLTGGSRMFDEWNYCHRLRHLGIMLRDRKHIVIRSAKRYASARIDALSRSDRP